MGLTLDLLIRFVREHGEVVIFDTTGKTRIIREGEPDISELIERADKFRWEGKWYNRSVFEQIVDDHLASGDVIAMP